MQAAEHLVPALAAGRAHDELTGFEEGWRRSPIGRDLRRVRNVKPFLSKLGTIRGILFAGFDMWANQLTGWSPFGTLKHGKPDHAALKPISDVTPIIYPKPDGKVSFDKLSSIFLSSTSHEEDQPSHLKLTDSSIPIERNLPVYGEPARLYCPAGVYEVVYADDTAKSDPRFVINAQNCIHCKTCDIKDPAQNITWTVPDGGDGPNYAGA
jgi:electron-transferring-flavoprotein dehydrogenase